MSAILIVISQRLGMEGIWITGLLAGIIILIIGLLSLGHFVEFIPSSVITGFTSGIAIIIFVGQIDNFLGMKTPPRSPLLKFVGSFRGGPCPIWHTVAVGGLVVLSMVVWPTRWAMRCARFAAGPRGGNGIAVVSRSTGTTIGAIPQTILLEQHTAAICCNIPWSPTCTAT